MSERWTIRRGDVDCKNKAKHIDGRLEELGLLNRRWPTPKGPHRRVDLGPGGGLRSYGLLSETDGEETRKRPRVLTQKPFENEVHIYGR